MKEFKVGDSASFSKTISEADVYQFAGIVGDFNPLHVNAVEAAKSRFKARVVHGALVSSFVSTVLAMYLPGPGTIYMEQKSTFVRPVYINDTITATVTIREIGERNVAICDTIVRNQDDVIVVDGYAKIKLPS